MRVVDAWPNLQKPIRWDVLVLIGTMPAIPKSRAMGSTLLGGRSASMAAAVVVEVGGRPVLEEAGAEAAQERGERGVEVRDILIGHGDFPPGDPIILLSLEPAL